MNREEVERVHFLAKGRSHYCRKYLLSLKCSRIFFFFLLLNLPFVPPNVLRFPPQSVLIFFFRDQAPLLDRPEFIQRRVVGRIEYAAYSPPQAVVR